MNSISQFNLIHDGWISCIFKDGTRKEIGILETLQEARDILEISHRSPLVVGSLHRLLLAILQRNLNVRTLNDLEYIWKNQSWEMASLSSYLNRWESRFNLFDQDRPFFQVPEFDKGKPVTVNKLGLELSAGNNTILFDHHFDEISESMAPAPLARLIVACQNFAVGGGKSSTVNLRHAPLAGKAQVLLKGNNLFETLTLNMIPYNPEYPKKFLGSEARDPEVKDRPAWELDIEQPGETRPTLGYLDYLTWQSRCIRLLPESSDEGTRASRMYFAQGMIMADENIRDPMAAYVESKSSGIVPISINQEEEPWRSLAALLQLSNEQNIQPAAIRVVADMVNDAVLDKRSIYQLDVIGVCSDQAKVHLWRHVRMPLPSTYLDNPELVHLIDISIRFSENVASILSSLAWGLAKEMFKNDASNRELISGIAQSFDIERDYWAGLEIPFYGLVEDLAVKEIEGDYQDMDRLLVNWGKNVVGRRATRSFERLLSNIGTDIRGMRASVKVRSRFYSRLYGEIRELEDKYENREIARAE